MRVKTEKKVEEDNKHLQKILELEDNNSLIDSADANSDDEEMKIHAKFKKKKTIRKSEQQIAKNRQKVLISKQFNL